MVTSKPTMDQIIDLLEPLRCREPHNTGFGCCRCNVNDVIDEIEDKLREIEVILLEQEEGL